MAALPCLRGGIRLAGNTARRGDAAHKEEPMNMRLPFRRKSLEELGRAVYREKVRPLVYPQETGKIVVIDVRTGDYEIGADQWDDVQPEQRLLARRPDAEIWFKCVCFQTVHAFGGLRVDHDG